MKRSVFQQNGVCCFIFKSLNNIKVSHQAVSLLHSLSSDRTSNHVQRQLIGVKVAVLPQTKD